MSKPEPRFRVGDVMTRDVVSATPDTPLSAIAETMISKRLRAIPVIDEQGFVVGLITDRQVLGHFLPHLKDRQALEEARSASSEVGGVAVRDAMQRSVMCVKEDEALADVAALMLEKGIGRVPVVREGVLVGFLTRGDMIRRLLGENPPSPPETEPPG